MSMIASSIKIIYILNAVLSIYSLATSLKNSLRHGSKIQSEDNNGRRNIITEARMNVNVPKKMASAQQHKVHDTESLYQYYGYTAANVSVSRLLGEWIAIDASENGQYLLACSDSSLYVSRDSGKMWTEHQFFSDCLEVTISASGQYMYASNFEGMIYNSSNYGSTWTALSSNSGLPVSSTSPWNTISTSSSGSTIIAGTKQNIPVYITNDYGASWTAITTLPKNGVSSVFISSGGSYVFAVDNTYIFVSSDGGQTFTATTPSVHSGASYYWQAIASSSDGQYAISGVQYGLLYISTNYGSSWSAYPSATQQWTAFAVSASGQYMTAVGYFGFVYVSSNYGDTWEMTNLGIQQWSSVTCDSTGQFITVAADQGYIYSSQNFGETWTPAYYNWVSIASSSSGQYLAAVQDGGYIFTSNDFGSAWIQTTAPLNSWTGIASDQTGQYLTAVSTGPYVYLSSNYGGSWSFVNLESTFPALEGLALAAVVSSSTGQFIAIASSGVGIYTSNNYGSSWTATNAPYEHWYAITCNSNCQLMAAVVNAYCYNCDDDPSDPSVGGYIYLSTDYGQNWNQATAPFEESWNSISSDSTGQYLTAAAGYGSGVFVSSDFGANWRQTGPDVNNWAAVTMDSTGQYQLAANGGGNELVAAGFVYRSINYGLNWTQIQLPASGYTSVSSDSTGQYLAAVAYEGCIFTSVDFGLTWTQNNITWAVSSTGSDASTSSSGLSQSTVVGVTLGVIFGAAILFFGVIYLIGGTKLLLQLFSKQGNPNYKPKKGHSSSHGSNNPLHEKMLNQEMSKQ